jgi:hypothetical protein
MPFAAALRLCHRPLAVLLAGLWFLEGCGAGWHQPAELGAAPLKPRQQVQVWQGGSVNRWHGVQVTADSIAGIPFQRPLDCDSCRVAVPRAAVDSLRLGDPEAAFWKSIGLGLGSILAIGALACIGGCPSGD